MVHEYMKPLSKCSKDELRLLLQGQLEAQERLVSLLVKSRKEDMGMEHLAGYDEALNIVSRFYGEDLKEGNRHEPKTPKENA